MADASLPPRRAKNMLKNLASCLLVLGTAAGLGCEGSSLSHKRSAGGEYGNTSGPAGPTTGGSGGSSGAAPLVPNSGKVAGDQAMSPGSNMGDKYTAPGTNPFVATGHDPFSTFAADVDTASYDIFRRDVNLGMVPHPASVRLEEYVNNFRYD